MFCQNCGNTLDGKFCTNCGQNNPNPPQQQYQNQYRVAPIKPPGTNFLLVTGILYIIGGFFSLIGSCINLLAVDFAIDMLPLADRTMVQFSWLAEIIVALWGIYIGIMGIILCKNDEKARMLKFFVILHVVFMISVIVFDFAIGLHSHHFQHDLSSSAWVVGFMFGFVMVTVVRFIVPFLFYIGAAKNAKYNRSIQAALPNYNIYE